MTKLITSISEIRSEFEAVIFDQWGVLHDGKNAFAQARQTLESLCAQDVPIVVLTNSGKRAQPNIERLAELGIGTDLYSSLVSSGEVLRQELDEGKDVANLGNPRAKFHVTMRDANDVEQWWSGLDPSRQAKELDEADVALFIGIPPGSKLADYSAYLTKLHERNLPMVCANPDLLGMSGTHVHIAPGAIAKAYEDNGGQAFYYGKPHAKVFDYALAQLSGIDPSKVLMCGDMLKTDIVGASACGLKTLLVRDGALGAQFSDLNSSAEIEGKITTLAKENDSPKPDFSIAQICP